MTERAHGRHQDRDSLPVCIVATDATLATSLAEELRLDGFRSRHFVSLAVFENFLRSATPGAILIDVDLLEDAAFTAIRQRWTAGATAPPLLVMADQDDMSNRLRAVAAGGGAFLCRPFSTQVLGHQLRDRLADQIAGDAPDVLLVNTAGNLGDCVETLAAAGISARVAISPDDTLAEMRRQRPDLLLVDGDGTTPPASELLLALRQIPAMLDVPALVLTAADKRRFDGVAAAAGIEGVVGRPIAPEDLVGIVSARLRRAGHLRKSWRYLARRDPETGLASQGHFRDEVRQVLSIAGTGMQRATLLHLDCHGEGAATRVAALAVCRALLRHIPAPGLATALAADRFAALIHSRDENTLEGIKAALHSELATPRPVTGHPCPGIEIRLGTTLLGTGLSSVDAALERARESALIAAGIQTEPEPQSSPDAEPPLSGDWQETLTEALRHSRFRLVYQPIASLTGEPTALYEVFVRMLDEDHNDVLPQEFLPAARRLGMARHIDRWVVRRAIQVLEEQHQRRDQPVLFIKLFPETMETASFLTWLGDQLRQSRTAPDRLVFQITQQDAGRQLAEARALTEGLRELGCGIALEHYRGGPDSTALLGKLPADYVKLSAELSRGITQNRALQQEVQAITGEARASGVHAIAALVQDATSLSALWAAGVEYIQGYFMQEPADIFGTEELTENE